MLTIGEFSKLGQVSARMLRHYDLLGLLRPESIGANGYRYYGPGQLATLRKIELLKHYGFKLAEIGALLPLDEAELAQALHARRLQTYADLHALQQKLRQLEEEIVNREGSVAVLSKYQVTVMEAPPQKVFCLRKTINISETHALFQELYAEMKKRGLTRAGVSQQMFMGEEFDYASLDLEAQVEVAEEGEGVRLLPGGSFVATTHIGPYESLKYAYDAIADWLAQHPEYQVTGNGIERYLKDEEMVQSPEELETGVLFPVKKLK